MSHDVFISYSTKDKAIADGVCATLEQNGIRCWIAPRDILPGMEYADALVEALHGSRVLVLVFSSGANASPQVHQEVERAVSSGKIVLPFRIEDVPPDRAMEFFISGRHWLDALTPPIEEHLLELARTVKLLLERADAGAAERHGAIGPAPMASTPQPVRVSPVQPPAVRAQASPALAPWLQMTESRALAHMRHAWILGMVSAAITLLMVMANLAGATPMPGLDVGWEGLIDVLFSAGFSYGIYRHLRWCAVGLLAQFALSKLVQWTAGGAQDPIAIVGALAFGYFFFQGMRGAMAYHALVHPGEPHPA